MSKNELTSVLIYVNCPNMQSVRYSSYGGLVTEIRQELPVGVRHGVSMMYFQGQACRRSVWKHGVRHGLEESWYTNGRLCERAVWVNGKRHGLFEGWHYNGNPMHQSEWAGGELHGKTSEWDMNGQHKITTVWNNGQWVA